MDGIKRFIVGNIKEVFRKNNGFGKSEKFPLIHFATILLNRIHFNKFEHEKNCCVSFYLRCFENNTIRQSFECLSEILVFETLLIR